MKRIFLASAVSFVAKHIAKHLDEPANEMSLVFIPTAAEAEEGDKQWLEDDRNALIETDSKFLISLSQIRKRKRLKKNWEKQTSSVLGEATHSIFWSKCAKAVLIRLFLIFWKEELFI